MKNFCYISGSFLLSQVASVLATPFLTRQYDANAFGDFYFIMSISLTCYVLLSLRMEWEIPNSEECDISAITWSSVVCSSLSALFLWVILWFIHAQKTLLFVPWFALALSLSEIFFIYNNRCKAYKLNAFLQITQGLLFPLLALCVLRGNEYGLIFSYILSLMIPNIYNLLLLISRSNHIFFLKGFLKHVKLIGIKNISISFGCLFNQLRQQTPMLLLPNCFGMHYVGIFGLLTRLINYPTASIANKISDIIFQEVGEMLRQRKNPQAFLRKMFCWIFLISSIGFSGILLFPDIICKIFVAKNWGLKAHDLQVMVLGALFYFLSSTVKQVPVLYKKNKIFLRWHFCFFLGILSVFFFQKIFNFNFFTFLCMVSCVQAFFCLWNIIKINFIVKKGYPN